MRGSIPLALGFVLALAFPCRGAQLRGSVTLPAPPADAPDFNPYPGAASAMPGHHAAPRGAMDDAVLYLERIPAAAESALAALPATRARLAQRDQSFVPRVVAVPVGGTVDFPNMDPIYHNVFSVSPTRRFDLGKYPRGHSKSVTFGRTGLVNVYCDIHSDMAAFILVVPNHACVQPAADGTFAFPDLPPGRYTLRLWHPDFGTVSREVDLSDTTPRVVEMRFGS